MILLSLLTAASVALQRYAIDGAIQIKSVEVIPSTIQNNQEGEHVALTVKINKRRCSFTYC